MLILLGLLHALVLADTEVLLCPERIPERCLLTLSKGTADSIVDQLKSIKWPRDWPDNTRWMPGLELFVIKDHFIVEHLAIDSGLIYSIRRNAFSKNLMTIDFSSTNWGRAALLPKGFFKDSDSKAKVEVIRSKRRFSPNNYIGCDVGWKAFDLVLPPGPIQSADSISRRTCYSRWRGKKTGIFYDIIPDEHLLGKAIAFRYADAHVVGDSAHIRNVLITQLTGKKISSMSYYPISSLPKRKVRGGNVGDYFGFDQTRLDRCGIPSLHEAQYWSGAFLFDGKVGLVLRGDTLYRNLGTTKNTFRFVDLSGRPDDIAGQLHRIDTCIPKSLGSQICTADACNYFIDGEDVSSGTCSEFTDKHVAFVVRWKK